jgi:1,4-alpha-glucan branching enzyme
MQLTPIDTDGWNMTSHPMKKNEYGVFEIIIPAKNNQKAIPHNSKIKVTHQIYLSRPAAFANRLSKTN